MDQHAIIGVWRLERHQRRNRHGEVEMISPSEWDGLLIYTSDGFMSAVMSKLSRSRFTSEDFRAGTPDETKAAFDGYLSYCGRYTIVGDQIVHHVEMSMFPNWSGGDQHRSASMQENKLVLTAPPMQLEGEEWTYELHWYRPQGPA
jgi:hypothetical protein